MGQYHSIKPGKPWYDTEGKRIQAHGGSMLFLNDTFYWYGENKEGVTDEKLLWHNGVRMYSSKDLYNWELLRDLIDYTDRNPRKYGAQYVDSIIDGDNLIWLCRQGYAGANSFHNSNYITCYVLENFRDIEAEVFES